MQCETYHTILRLDEFMVAQGFARIRKDSQGPGRKDNLRLGRGGRGCLAELQKNEPELFGSLFRGRKGSVGAGPSFAGRSMRAELPVVMGKQALYSPPSESVVWAVQCMQIKLMVHVLSHPTCACIRASPWFGSVWLK